jgi:predicted transcriptional regulator
MGNPDREKGWLRRQYNDVKGHAKWDLMKLGAVVFLGSCAGIVRWFQHAPRWQVCGLVIVPPTLLCCVFAFWHYLKSRAQSRAGTPSGGNTAVPPPVIYSTLVTELEGPTLDRMTFEVLKWFNTFPRFGAAPVSHVAQVHGIDSSAAFAYVQKLLHLGFIWTAVIAPGEGNGQYQITDKGRHYVRTHAT